MILVKTGQFAQRILYFQVVSCKAAFSLSVLEHAMSDHKDIVYIGPSVVYEAGEEPFERQAAIQTLLHALQEVRMGRIDSVAFIGWRA